MREILFKAKRKDNGEWVEGDFQQDRDLRLAYISGFSYYSSSEGLQREPFLYEIDILTLCQYTGLTDKNGNKIWENDILRYSYEYPGSPWLKKGEDIKYSVGAVFWQEWRGAWAVCGHGTSRMINQDVFTYCRNPNRTEVIGNIFDNTELLGEVEDE